MLDQWWATMPPEVHAALHNGGLDNAWVAIGITAFVVLGVLGALSEYEWGQKLIAQFDYTLIILLLAVHWGGVPLWFVGVYLLSLAHYKARENQTQRIIAAITGRN